MRFLYLGVNTLPVTGYDGSKGDFANEPETTPTPQLEPVKPVSKAFTGRPTQAEANYIPLSTVSNKACANCRWFLNDGCFIIDEYPEPIIATGYCDRHELTPVPEPPADVAEVIAEALGEVLEEQAETIATSIYASPMWDMGKEKKPFKQRFADFFKSLTPKAKDESFSVFKGQDGKWYWHAIFTNNFKDLEDEIITEAAHDRYIARLDAGLVPMPTLQRWHTPGTDHGKAMMIWRSGHFVHAVGTFDETPLGEKALNYYRKNKGIDLMSHGFMSPEWAYDGKHYDDYNTFEITTLPPFAAANPFTSFEEIKEMAMTEEKRRDLDAVFGKGFAATLEAKDLERGKALEDARVAYKDYAHVEPEKPKADKPADEKAIGSLYTELLDGQNEMLGMVKGLVGALKSKDTEIAAVKADADKKMEQLVKELGELRTIVNAPPRRASQDESTINKDETLKDKLPKEDAVSKFFGGMVKVENN